MSALVHADRQGSVLRLTLDNPPANLLSVAVMEALQFELDAGRDDADVRVIIVAAAGKLFSAGHDLKEMQSHRSDDDGGKAFFEQTFALCSRLMQSIAAHPRPIIAEVDGIATAAGCQLVASCDLAVASERSRFGVNGIDVGLFCSTPGVALTRTINRKRAMEMLLTGDLVSPQQALEWGLINRVVPPDALIGATEELARKIAEKPPVTVAEGKRAFYAQMEQGVAKAYEIASTAISCSFAHAEGREGMEAFIEKRPPPGKKH